MADCNGRVWAYIGVQLTTDCRWITSQAATLQRLSTHFSHVSAWHTSADSLAPPSLPHRSSRLVLRDETDTDRLVLPSDRPIDSFSLSLSWHGAVCVLVMLTMAFIERCFTNLLCVKIQHSVVVYGLCRFNITADITCCVNYAHSNFMYHTIHHSFVRCSTANCIV